MKLTLIRHAQSVANSQRRWQGRLNSDLSDEGRRQATELGARLHAYAGRFDLVIASPLNRTVQTAQALGVPFETSEDWLEIDVGHWEGLTNDEVAERFADEAKSLFEGDLDRKVGQVGESWNDVYRRIDAAVAQLRGRVHESAHVCVVAHGGVINGVVTEVFRIRDRKRRPAGRIVNTAITELEFDGDKVRMTVYNDAEHAMPWGPWVQDRFDKGKPVQSLLVAGDESRHGEVAKSHPSHEVVPHTHVADTARDVLALTGEDRHRVVHAAPGGMTHILETSAGPVLADYNTGSVYRRR